MKIQTGSQLRVDDFGSIQCPTCGEIIELGLSEDENIRTGIHCDRSIRIIPSMWIAVVDKITEQNIDQVLEYNTLYEDEEDEDENIEVNGGVDVGGVDVGGVDVGGVDVGGVGDKVTQEPSPESTSVGTSEI